MEERRMRSADYQSRQICPGVTIGALQKKSLEIFKYFQDICEREGFRYWCGGGTCIGALRHQGFIPWDDDIDVFMPRPDYEKLYHRWNEIADTQRYALCRTTRQKNYHQTDMQLVDLQTTFINRHSMNEDILHGVSIDIMPFEGCPRSRLKRGFQIYHSILYSVFNAQRLPDHQGKLLRFITMLVLNAVRDPDQRYRIWSKHERLMAQYDFDKAETVKETVTSFRALFYAYPRAYFETVEAPFEDISIRIPAGAREYMTRIFGEYTRLPPEEERTAKHDVVYANLDEPFLKFKGKYYLVKSADGEHRCCT